LCLSGEEMIVAAIPLGMRQGMILSSATYLIKRECDAEGECELVEGGN